MADQETLREIRRVARELSGTIIGLERRLNRVESGLGAMQLNRSSLEDGYIVANDADGNERQRIGRQRDGRFGESDRNGPPPPAPTAPTVESDTLGLTVTWDGSFDGANRPSDFARVQIHISATSGFMPDVGTVVTTLTEAGEQSISPLAVETKFVVLVAVTTSGVTGDPSAEVSATPNEVVATDVIGEIIDETNLADEAVTQAKIAAEAVGTGEIQGEAVDLSKLADGSVDATKLIDGSVDPSKITFNAREIGGVTVFRQESEPTGTEMSTTTETWGDATTQGSDWTIAEGADHDWELVTRRGSPDVTRITDGLGEFGSWSITGSGFFLLSGDFADVDVYFTMEQASGDSDNKGWLAALRYGDSGYYLLGVSDNNSVGFSGSLSDFSVCILKEDETILAETPATADLKNFRAQAIGSTLRVKAWALGDSEPSAWTLEATDTDYASGRIGLATSSKGEYYAFSDFTATEIGPLEESDLWYEENPDGSVSVSRWDGSAWVALQHGPEALAAGAVIAGKVAADAIGADEIVANSITAALIAADTITAGQIAAEAIGTNELAANSIIAGKIASDEIETRHIVARAIQAGQIAVETILAENIATDAVVARTIEALAVTADKLAANSVIAGKIAAGEINADHLATLILEAVKIYSPTDDPNTAHLELGDSERPIWFGKEGSTGFEVSYDAARDVANTFVSGRTAFGRGSELENDWLDLLEQRSTGMQEPSLRQSVNSPIFQSGGITSKTASWSLRPKQENVVFAAVAAMNQGASSPPPDITPADSDWTLVETVTSINRMRLSLFMISGEPRPTDDETFNTDTTAYITIQLFEYEGLRLSPLDQFATDSDTTTPTASTGTTATTTQAAQLWLGVITQFDSERPTSPTDGFSKVQTSYARNTSSGTEHLGTLSAANLVTSTGTAGTTATVSSSWMGLVATFDAAPADPDPPVPAADTVRLYTKPVSGSTIPHMVDATGRTWSLAPDLIEEISLTADTAQVDFTNIPQHYRHLQLLCAGAITGTAIRDINLLFNNDSTIQYEWFRSARAMDGSFDENGTHGGDALCFGRWGSQDAQVNSAALHIYNYNTSTHKLVLSQFGGSQGDVDADFRVGTAQGQAFIADSVTEVNLFQPAGESFRAESIFSLYGLG